MAISTPTISFDKSFIIDLLYYATVTRYLTAAGFTVLLYDHILTFPAEVSLIWNSPPSLSKYLFLLNRYLVPSIILMVSYEMTAWFSGKHLTDIACKRMLGTLAITSVTSIGIADLLVLIQVIRLWDRNLIASSLLAGGFVVSFVSTLSLMIAVLIRLWDNISFSPLVSMCVVSETSYLFVVVWSCPALFDFIVLASTAWNAVSRPRDAHLPLTRALHRDGVTFFLALTLLRVINLSLAATFKPELTLIAVFVVWSMATLILSRSIMRLKRVELLYSQSRCGTPSPSSSFGLGFRPPDIPEHPDVEMERFNTIRSSISISKPLMRW